MDSYPSSDINIPTAVLEIRRRAFLALAERKQAKEIAQYFIREGED